MKKHLFTLGKYLIGTIIVALIFYVTLKYLFKIKDLSYFGVLGMGALIMALSSVLSISKRQRKMYDKHMESFYFEQRRNHF